MNNKSLVNLKFTWNIPGLGEFKIDGNWPASNHCVLKPLGWHTASRAWARRIVSIIRHEGPSPALLEAFRYSVNNRHYPEKGWHI